MGFLDLLFNSDVMVLNYTCVQLSRWGVCVCARQLCSKPDQKMPWVAEETYVNSKWQREKNQARRKRTDHS